ncbi:Bone marrow stromal antigen 2 [Myotis brandtii]|uniref:Bone marrow stromal antigen 2 n=1 Tax=Myotis brandtii TaxID=109478 RepID=S7N8H4_MYOBR|nr:Bone marrow stromal antigen 2 [Myotis brandtii]
MAPTSCCYSQLPTDEFQENLGDRKLPVWVGILLGLLVVGLSVAVGVLAAKFNSPACKDGLPAEQECRNITHLLEQELTQAQEVLRGTEAQAATCNQTVRPNARNSCMAGVEVPSPQPAPSLIRDLSGDVLVLV